jgi:hypothetical protein
MNPLNESSSVLVAPKPKAKAEGATSWPSAKTMPPRRHATPKQSEGGGWILFWFVSTQISHLRRWDTEDSGDLWTTKPI